MNLVVNGTAHEAPCETTVHELLGLLGIRPEIVAVEVNGELVLRSNLANTKLAEGDQVEFVTLVGGG